MFAKAICAVLCLLFAVAMPTQVQSTTSGLRGLSTENDARVWQAVGRLDAAGYGFCTGTLISPEYVLTAAHCVYDKRSGMLVGAETLTFRAGFRNGDVAAVRGISQIEAHPGYDPKRSLDDENVRHDVALLRLDRPIPTTELDPFVMHDRVVSKGSVSVVSYGRGREDLPSRQDVCQVEQTREDVMFMDCDITFGSSGAPVFRHFNGRGKIVSVVSGMTRIDGKKYAVGMVLPDVVAELRHRMWANQEKPTAQIKRITVGSDGGASGAKFVRP